MRRDLGLELNRHGRDAALSVAPKVARLASSEIQEVAYTPQGEPYQQTTSAPASGSTRTLDRAPMVPGTLALVDRSSGVDYVAGVDFEEANDPDGKFSAFRNLGGIVSGRSLDAAYYIYVSSGGGSDTQLGSGFDERGFWIDPAVSPDVVGFDTRGFWINNG